ncbi:unnamed protein product [Leptidea sinapis]|uniref:Uncharacterized protein n=1 Tax=Leptidea sinapis TaxID=189913 RepID=A0A5E4QMX5_9NEOP|nr:unnamed protein product [Leptidea sinapis]
MVMGKRVLIFVLYCLCRISGNISLKPVNHDGNDVGFRDAKQLLIFLYPRLPSDLSAKSHLEIESPEDMEVSKSVSDIVEPQNQVSEESDPDQTAMLRIWPVSCDRRGFH